MRIGIIGLGTIATALAHALAQDGHSITVSERSAKNAAQLSKNYENVSVAANQTVVDASDVMFLGLTDDVHQEVLSALTFRADQTVLSLMATPTRESVTALVAPARLAARMLPYPSIAKGGSQILVCGETKLVDTLLGARNSIFEIESEEALNAWLCAQAVLSPAVLMVKEAASWLASQGADPDQAEQFLRELVGSSLLAGQCAPLLQALDTPGGYNQQLREKLVHDGMVDSLIGGLKKMRT